MANFDYCAAHLQWISNHPNFVPKEQPFLQYGYSYYDIMSDLYTTQKKHPNINSYAEKTFICDKLWLNKTLEIDKLVNKKVEKLEPTPNGWWFVTIGFNHDTWNISDCCKCIEKILNMEWIISAKANFELFRSNGMHPHVHFIIETKEPKSRILDKLFRPLYVKKVVFSKNFIDVKIAADYHYKYIKLDKQTDKLEHVEKDKKWREQNNIPDYEKNWTIS